MAVQLSRRDRLLAALGIRPHPEKSTHRRNYSSKRYGQQITDAHIDGAIHRNDACHFLVKGLPLQAFREGYELVLNDKPVEWTKAFQKAYNVTRAAQIERGYGRVTDVLMKRPNGEYAFESFKPVNTAMELDEYGWPMMYHFTLKIGGTHPDIIIKVEGSNLSNVFVTMLRPTDYRWKGRSVLEPLWDVLDTRYSLMQSMDMYTSRVAAGIRKAKIASRGSPTADDSVEAAYELGLRGLEAGDTSIILKSFYDPDSGQWVSDELDIDQGSGQFDFSEKQDLCHKGIAMNTSIPKNIMDGIFQGGLVGAETVRAQLLSSYRELQVDWTPEILLRAERFAEIMTYEWNDEIEVEWTPVVTLSDREKEEIDKLRTERLLSLYNSGMIEQSYLQQELGLPVKAIERPAMFEFGFQGQDGQQEKKDGPDPKSGGQDGEEDKEIDLE